MRSDVNRAKVTLEEITSSTSKLADHVDELATTLLNEIDSEEPLWTLLENLIQGYKDEHPDCKISSDIDCADYDIDIPDIVATQLVLIIQEIMNNIYTHSNANKVVIKIFISNRLVDVFINDNGVGIDSNYSDNSPWYSGLHKVKEIIYLLNGTFKIDGDIISGTNVRFTFPLV
jgi:two-component system sensor histidine kinase DegS